MKAKNNGSILITTLWIMAILALLAMGIGFRASLEVRLSKYAMDKLGARYLAKAGLIKAITLIPDDKKKNYDTLYECGMTFERDKDQTPKNVFGHEHNALGEGSFSVSYEAETGTRYGMIDEERKLNINISKLTNGNLKEYRTIMRRFLPEPEEDTTMEDILNAIIDWQDKDSIGAAEDYPYKCKNGDFELIEELLLVKGITLKYFNRIKGLITVYGKDGKINVNTAPREVLVAIIPSPEIVEGIIIDRAGRDREESDDDLWKNMGSFTGYLGVRIQDPSEMVKRLTVASNYFRIISHGKIGRIESTITAVVNRESVAKKQDNAVMYEYYHEE